MSGTKPWERQITNTGSQEPDKAFHAFGLYRDMAPNERSLEAVTAVLRARPGSDQGSGNGGRRSRVSGQVERWSKTWNWVLRARAWDDEVDRHKRLAQLEEIQVMSRRHAQELEATAWALKQPVMVLMKRLRDRPLEIAQLETMPLPDLFKLCGTTAMFLPSIHKAERQARGNPDQVAAALQDKPQLEIAGAEFTWVQANCACGHPHEVHDQEYAADPTKMPCAAKGCGCQRFTESIS